MTTRCTKCANKITKGWCELCDTNPYDKIKQLEAENKELKEWSKKANDFIDKSKEPYNYSQAVNLTCEYDEITSTTKEES